MLSGNHYKGQIAQGVIWPFLFGGRRRRWAVSALNPYFIFGAVFAVFSDSPVLQALR